MNNTKVLQKIRTYVKNEGMVDFFISDELDNKDNIIRKEIKKIESYPENSLKNQPIRFVFFKCNDFYILLKSKHLEPTKGDSRRGNFITHSLVLNNKVEFFSPIDYLDSNCFKLDIPNTLPKKDLSLFDMIHSISFQRNDMVFSERNKQLLLAMMITCKENKHLITISNNINPILKELIYLLPPNIRRDITFSNLEFSKISKRKTYKIYNYSDYSLNLTEMNSYKNFYEIMKDAEKINYLCFNYEDDKYPKITEQNRYVNFIFNSPSKIEMFYSFTEKYNYSLSELDLLTLLFEYEASNINLTQEELERIIHFVKEQDNEESFKKIFILIQSKQDYKHNFTFFIYFLELFKNFFSKEEFVEILYYGIEKALYDETYRIDLLFKKLFEIHNNDKELRILHTNFIDSLIEKKNFKSVLKSILIFNAYSFDILKFELKNHYFEFIANTDKDSLVELIEFYQDKRFPKSLILVKYNQQDMQKYLFKLLENSEFSIWDLANHNMNEDIKAYFEYKLNEIISKNFLKKIIPFQKDELSLLKEFNRRLNTENDIFSDLVEIVIYNNKLNFTTLVDLYTSYSRYDEKNKKLIFHNLNNILEKKFSKFYDKIDFLNELHLNIEPYPYLLTGLFVYKIDKNNYIDLKSFKLEENIIPLEIIKNNKLDKKILKIVQKKYDNRVKRKNEKDKKLVFKDLLMLRVFN
jgi:hypothetical protein